jgi:hypothetical protein
MATIPLTYDVATVGYDYATGGYDALSLNTQPSAMSQGTATAATITPA